MISSSTIPLERKANKLGVLSPLLFSSRFNRRNFDGLALLVERAGHLHFLGGKPGGRLLIAQPEDILAVIKRIRILRLRAHLYALIRRMIFHHVVPGAAHRVRNDALEIFSVRGNRGQGKYDS